MNRVSIAQFGCAATMSLAGLAASGATVDLGTISGGTPTPFSGSMIPAGTFSDIFTFTLPANAGSGYSVLNLPLSIPSVGTFNTLLTTMSLFSDPDGTPFTPDDRLLASMMGPGNSLNLAWGATPGGAMYLNVTGVTNGTLGGLYNGAISVTSVPEAEVWAMMLIGAGLAGVQLRRKAKRATSNRLALKSMR